MAHSLIGTLKKFNRAAALSSLSQTTANQLKVKQTNGCVEASAYYEHISVDIGVQP
jgi:hypothetical protein